MSERCDVCSLPDLHYGYGDGIGSCDCPRCECGVAEWSDLCTCPPDDDEPWPEASEEENAWLTSSRASRTPPQPPSETSPQHRKDHHA